jgi:chromosome segregation ATPase
MMDQVTAQEVRRHFDVVADGLRGDLRMLAEGIAGTHERLDRVEVRLDRVEVRLDRVESRLGRVEVRLDEVQSELRDVKVTIARGNA